MNIFQNFFREISLDLRRSFLYEASRVAQPVKNLPAMQEIWVRSLGQEDPLEKGMAKDEMVGWHH